MPDNKFSELFAAREKTAQRTTEKPPDSDSATETEAAGVELPLEEDPAEAGSDSPPDSAATAESDQPETSTQTRSSRHLSSRPSNGGDAANEDANGGGGGEKRSGTSGTSARPLSEAPETSGAGSPVHEGDKAHNPHKRPPGRPPGKRSNPEYEQATVYIRRDTHKAVKLALLGHEDPRQFSELVEDLLQQWVES